ncbi:hypothetical protein CW304_05855 [Bacillus sp. UFRGS-B20]|nr:hypothetical protein CW304_05855 [Bacillus sp. UFRGS-B20]
MIAPFVKKCPFHSYAYVIPHIQYDVLLLFILMKELHNKRLLIQINEQNYNNCNKKDAGLNLSFLSTLLLSTIKVTRHID